MEVYRRVGEPRPVDKERVRKREALPSDVELHEAEEDDYDWRLALGAAYRRAEGGAASPLEDAHERAEELPDQLEERVHVGFERYIDLTKAEGIEPDEDDLARVMDSLVEACQPGKVSRDD